MNNSGFLQKMAIKFGLIDMPIIIGLIKVASFMRSLHDGGQN